MRRGRDGTGRDWRKDGKFFSFPAHIFGAKTQVRSEPASLRGDVLKMLGSVTVRAIQANYQCFNHSSVQWCAPRKPYYESRWGTASPPLPTGQPWSTLPVAELGNTSLERCHLNLDGSIQIVKSFNQRHLSYKRRENFTKYFVSILQKSGSVQCKFVEVNCDYFDVSISQVATLEPPDLKPCKRTWATGRFIGEKAPRGEKGQALIIWYLPTGPYITVDMTRFFIVLHASVVLTTWPFRSNSSQ